MSQSLWMASVWFGVIPGIVEVAAFCVCWVSVVHWFPAYNPSVSPIGALLAVAGICLVMWFIAFRLRFLPILGHTFCICAILVSWLVVDYTGLALFGPQFTNVFDDVVLYGAAGAAAIASIHRGFRIRHRVVPCLVNRLTTGAKNARRQAICVLQVIHDLDQVQFHEEKHCLGRILGRFWKSDTPAGLTDAVPALQAALQDDDLFVRTQAAKVLAKLEPPMS